MSKMFKKTRVMLIALICMLSLSLGAVFSAQAGGQAAYAENSQTLYTITGYSSESIDLDFYGEETVQAGEIFSVGLTLWGPNPYSGHCVISEYDGITVVDQYASGKIYAGFDLLVGEGGGCFVASFWCTGGTCIGTVAIIVAPQEATSGSGQYNITGYSPESIDLDFYDTEMLSSGDIFGVELTLWPPNPYAGDCIVSEYGITVVDEYAWGKVFTGFDLVTGEEGGFLVASFWCLGGIYVGTVVIIITPAAL